MNNPLQNDQAQDAGPTGSVRGAWFRRVDAPLAGLIAFTVYLFTLAPGLAGMDSGELSAVQATLGIAHPSGYPLFTLLGHLFLFLPLPLRPITQLNLLSAVWCAGGVVFFVLTVRTVLLNLGAFRFFSPAAPNFSVRDGEGDPLLASGVAFASGLALAFSRTYWLESTSVEVYSLHLFLLLGSLYFFVRALLHEDQDLRPRALAPWFVFAGFFGLALANHLVTLLLLPGLAVLYFARFGFRRDAVIRVGWMLTVLLPIVVLLYAYLPLRASQSPSLNWGNPSTFEGLYHHIRGTTYQLWQPVSYAEYAAQTGRLLRGLPGEFSLVGLLAAMIGVACCWSRARLWLAFLALSAAATLLHAGHYTVPDTPAYYLLLHIVIAFFIAFGLLDIVRRIHATPRLRPLIPVVLIAFPVPQLLANASRVTRHGLTVFEDYSRAVLESVEPDALILTNQWGLLVSEGLYLQQVEDVRPDVDILSADLLTQSWYLEQLESQKPGILEDAEEEAARLLRSLQSLQAGGRFSPEAVEQNRIRLLTALIASNASRRPVYVTPELLYRDILTGRLELPGEFTIAPHLFLSRVVDHPAGYVEAPLPDFQISYPSRLTQNTHTIRRFVASALQSRARYELDYDNIQRSQAYIRKLRTDYPEVQIEEKLLDILPEKPQPPPREVPR